MKHARYWLVVLLLCLTAIPLTAQDTHTPKFLGIFFDTKNGLQELVVPVSGLASSVSAEQVVCNLNNRPWHPLRAIVDDQMGIVIYGDEYLPSDFHLYRSSSGLVHDRYPKPTLLLNEVRLRTLPISGLPAKCYRLLPEKGFDEAEYLIEHKRSWYPLSLSSERKSKPITGDLTDIGTTGDGKVIVSTTNGLYIWNGENWTFKELRGERPIRLFTNEYDKQGAFYYLDEQNKDSILVSFDCGLTFSAIAISDIIGKYHFEEYSPITVLDMQISSNESRVFYSIFDGIDNARSSIKHPMSFSIIGNRFDNAIRFGDFRNKRYRFLLAFGTGPKFIVGTDERLRYSSNGGEDWEWDSKDGPMNAAIGCVVVDSVSNLRGLIYQADQDVILQALKAYERSSWAHGQITSFRSDKISLLASSSTEGVFESFDCGRTWNAINNGLTGLSVKRVVSLRDRPNIIYALTTVGLFRSVDRGKSWVQE